MSVTQQTTSTKSTASETLTGPLLVVLAVVVVAGLLFGYDQGVISGALDGIKQQFMLSAILVEVVTSWVTLGALVGSLAGGWLADHYGRRRAVLIAGALFVVGALLQATAPDVPLLVFGRLVVGFGVGVAAVAAPLYGSELAPAAHRGRFVAAYQLAITIGIFLAYLVNAGLAADGDWRWMLGISLVPGVLLVLVGALGVESPRWLVKMGRRDEARAVLGKVWPEEDNAARLKAIEHTLDEEAGKASWREVFDPAWRKPLMIALGLAIFQQITGINAIIYYANQIFAAAGFSTAAQQTTATTWAVGGVNVAATFIAIAFIDKLGRRPLLLAGLIGMGLALLVVGFAFLSIDGQLAGNGPRTAGIVTLVALVVFIVSFAFSLGPVVWTVINEIFPGKVRGRAVAVATAVNWGSAFLVSQFFLTLIDAIGKSTTFWLFAFFCAAGWIWVYRTVPETRGRTLEDIERSWTGQPASVSV
ncbi:sugar porter family MFS transporter [Mesorhizobium sp. VNQ89]|uniref:sugar porter family MFS transporter n=1 Tax=Mesorhizobium quangtriensis TaxID=3157709 RepID=UPI0032B72EB5